MKVRVSAIIFLFFAFDAIGAVSLPQQLSGEDRRVLLSILGYGSQSKLLSSPVPLGGSQGFEMGLSSEYIPIEDLSGLGAKTDVRGELSYQVLTFGKGLPYNVDTFVHLTPLQRGNGVSSYGGHLRWGFHEFRRFPAILTFVLHASGANYDNLLDARTTGADLVMTVAMEDAALYFGGGNIRTIGTFRKVLTVENTETSEDLSGVHTVFGLSLSFGDLFMALEVDRVEQSVYGGRFGLRF